MQDQAGKKKLARGVKTLAHEELRRAVTTLERSGSVSE